MNAQYNYEIKHNYAFDENNCHNVVFCHLNISNLDQLRTILDNIKKNPIIMCIIDTWLCNDILDIELGIPSYQNNYHCKNRIVKITNVLVSAVARI